MYSGDFSVIVNDIVILNRAGLEMICQFGTAGIPGWVTRSESARKRDQAKKKRKAKHGKRK